jgi:hypothetical protein
MEFVVARKNLMRWFSPNRDMTPHTPSAGSHGRKVAQIW